MKPLHPESIIIPLGLGKLAMGIGSVSSAERTWKSLGLAPVVGKYKVGDPVAEEDSVNAGPAFHFTFEADSDIRNLIGKLEKLLEMGQPEKEDETGEVSVKTITEKAKGELAFEIACNIAGSSRNQIEAAREGWTGIDEMSEECLLQRFKEYGIDPYAED